MNDQAIEPLEAEATEILGAMPTISFFYGIFIQMFFNDHAPPTSM